MRRLLIPLAILAGSAMPAVAAGRLALSSDVFVEKLETRNGKPHIVLAAPDTVRPGDQLVFVLRYRNAGDAPADNMVITNPLPAAIAFQEAQGAIVSVDGGKSWGNLAAARVRTAQGQWRAARPDDVTHIRWELAKAIPAGGEGNLKFRGTVR